MNNKYSLKKSLKGLLPYIRPYKWQFVIAIIMIFAFNISIALAPSFEGKITTQLASDVAKSSNLTNITISFDIISYKLKQIFLETKKGFLIISKILNSK